MSDSWLWMKAAELGAAIDSGAIDPRDLVETFLDAIEDHPHGESIYARTTPPRARSEAAAAAERAKLGLRRGPLDGVPISWKDLYDTASILTEAGSALLKGRVPESDADILATATREGLVCLGKTHMSELAFSGLGVNPVTATPPNINDPETAPGGSSSGAATSVAYGLAVAGIGSDTGGSIRLPAAWNDLVGLKASHNALPDRGVVPLCPSIDTFGPLCRSVEDAGLIFAAMSGGRAPDLGGVSLIRHRFLALTPEDLGECEPEPARAYEAALRRLAAAGAEIVEGTLPQIEAIVPLSPCLYAGEAYGVWREEIEAAPDLMYDRIRTRFRSGSEFSAPDYVAARRKLDEIRAAYYAETAGFDGVLLPTSPILPPSTQRLLEDEAYYTKENLRALKYTRIGNLLGVCGLTLPTGMPGCGISLMLPPGAERQLVRLGHAMETALAK